MTDKQINAAIAEACGWKLEKHYWLTPEGYEACGWDIPDYHNDLNAMHEAEKVLKHGDLLFEYGMHISISHRFEDLLRATARQRAEAFLRTLGKWEEVQG